MRPTLFELLTETAETVESTLTDPRLASELEACPIAHRNALQAYAALRVAAALFDAQAEGLVPEAPRPYDGTDGAHASTPDDDGPDSPAIEGPQHGLVLPDELTPEERERSRLAADGRAHDRQVHEGPARALICGCLTDASVICPTHAVKS